MFTNYVPISNCRCLESVSRSCLWENLVFEARSALGVFGSTLGEFRGTLAEIEVL